MMFAASPVDGGEPFNEQAAKRLAFFGETTVTYFVINFKELKSMEKVVGSSRHMSISIGYLQHCGMYVVAKNMPS